MAAVVHFVVLSLVTTKAEAFAVEFVLLQSTSIPVLVFAENRLFANLRIGTCAVGLIITVERSSTANTGCPAKNVHDLVIFLYFVDIFGRTPCIVNAGQKLVVHVAVHATVRDVLELKRCKQRLFVAVQ